VVEVLLPWLGWEALDREERAPQAARVVAVLVKELQAVRAAAGSPTSSTVLFLVDSSNNTNTTPDTRAQGGPTSSSSTAVTDSPSSLSKTAGPFATSPSWIIHCMQTWMAMVSLMWCRLSPRPLDLKDPAASRV